MKRKGIAVICISVFAVCVSIKFVFAWSAQIAPADTHYDITKDVLANAIASAEYPDLIRFSEKIERGANTETHDIPDGNNTQWWSPNPATWFTAGETADGQEGALSIYKKYSFEDAYLHIGYELHLVQDEWVPSHIRFCHHGAWPYYVDDLEYWATILHSYANTNTPWTYQFSHSGGTSTFQYWLSDDLDDDDKDDIGGDPDDEVDATGT